MSAKHPITGAPIRIMRTGTQLWKDGKTLSWVQNNKNSQNSQNSQNSHHTQITVGLEDATSADFIAMDIRQAMYHLGTITGDISTDDLLGNIFSKFCIGK
jgi:tRNA U34 5-carboxymethylaminomethyl modifying GTPase MnmE/TrmE